MRESTTGAEAVATYSCITLGAQGCKEHRRRYLIETYTVLGAAGWRVGLLQNQTLALQVGQEPSTAAPSAEPLGGAERWRDSGINRAPSALYVLLLIK